MDSSPKRRRFVAVLKVVASLLIVSHLCAVVVAPASVPPAPSSTQQLFAFFRPYLDVAYLNHGYHFFAPDPGSSSLIEYVATTKDGQRIWGRIPDRNGHRPRLLYHRHFMLAEFYGAIPPSQKELRESFAMSLAQQILKQQNATSVELSHVVHELTSRSEVLTGKQLTAPEKYVYNPLGIYSLEGRAAQEQLISNSNHLAQGTSLAQSRD